MSEEVLRSYTQQTLNFGVDFLSKLSSVALPDELTEMHKHLIDCFNQLNKAWENINKITVKNKTNFKLDELKNQLTELDNQKNAKPPKRPIFKSMSIGNLAEAHASDSLIGSDSDHEATFSQPNSNNNSPIIPPKLKGRNKNSKANDGYEVFGTTYENFRKSESIDNETFEKRLERGKGLTLPSSFERSTIMAKLALKNNDDDDYLIVEKERKLPVISKFTQLNKMSNVIVNRWQLGERYCGISEGVLYIFLRFQDIHAEISMELPKMYIGKGSNEKSILFQTREILIELVSSDKEMQEKFYHAAFRSQNIYNKTARNVQGQSPPMMPKPYSRKDSETNYINISTNIAHKIKRWRPVKMRPDHVSVKQEDNDDYVDSDKVDTFFQVFNQNNSKDRVKTSY